ncbi:MAG: HAD family hydrolase [Nocardioidaceae bacterium]
MTGRPVDTVVFDLGGVLIDWDPRYLYRQLLPEGEIDAFLTEIGFAAWNHAQDAGRPWDEAVAELAGRHPHRRALIEAYPSRFGETMSGPIDDTVTILRELHARGTPLLALTNWSAETFREARETFSFLELFDAIVVSGEERLAKPDPRIFRLLLDRHGLEPEATVYIDDSPANVETARGLGLAALHFTGPARLRADLAAAGLLNGRS